MAELTKPQYHNPKSYPSDRKVYPVASARTDFTRPSDVPDQMFAVANVFDALSKGLKQNILANEQSQKTANRLQAKDLIVSKMKHHSNLMTQLGTHLDKTAPENLILNDLVDKIGDRDGLGRTELNIGKNLDVNISPMMLPDGLNEDVKFLTEEAFVRMDTELLSKLVGGINEAQTKHDLNYLTQEQRNFRSKIRAGFASSKYDSSTGLQFAKGHLEKMVAGIMERSEQGGTLDAYEIQEEIDKSIQTMLQEWYNHDVANPNIRKDQVIANAEREVYSHEYVGVDGKSKKYLLSPNYYQGDITARNNKNENTYLQNEAQQKVIDSENAFATYTDWFSAKNNRFQGRHEAMKRLMNIDGVKQGEVLRWISEQEAIKNNGVVSKLEQDMLRDFEFYGKDLLKKLTDKEMTTKENKKGETVQTAVKDKNGNIKLIPKKGKALETAIRSIYKNQYYTEEQISAIKEGLISSFITASLIQDRQAQKVDLSNNQSAYIKTLGIQAKLPKSSGGILRRFTTFNKLDEPEIDGAKVVTDPELIILFGEGNREDKINAIAGAVLTAIGTHNQYLKTMQGKEVKEEDHTSMLRSITAEYVENAKSALEDGFRNPRGAGALIAPGEEEGPEFWSRYRRVAGKRNSGQLLDEHELEDKLDGMMSIGQNIVDRNLQELEEDIKLLDRKYPSNSLTDPLKTIIVKAIEVRRTNLIKNPAFLALKETKQDIEQALEEGKQIDVQALYDHQDKYGVKDRGRLLPENILARVGFFTEQGENLDKRLSLYTQIYAMSELFGDKKTQNLAKWQFRQAIKGSGITGNKSGTPALAFLTDIWDGLETKNQLELFEIATTKFSATDAPESDEGEKFAEIKNILKERHQKHGMKSTMQSHAQVDDLSVLEEKMIRARADNIDYMRMDAKDMATSIHQELFPDNYVLKTGRVFNAVVSIKAFKANGLDPEKHAPDGQDFILSQMDKNGGSWTLMPTDENITEGVLIEKFRKSLLSDLPPGVRRWEDSEGRIWERIDEGEPRQVYADIFTKLRDKQTIEITEDIIKANSDNLRKGLISVGDGYEIGVYLVPDDGDTNRSKLIGKFFETKNGKQVPKFISQHEFVGASASPYITKFLMNPKFLTPKLHEYVRELRTEGSKKAGRGTLGDKISEIPFFRFFDSLGKLELDHAIEPLHSAMEEEAKRLGVETLSYRQARDILEEFNSRQDSWFKNDYIPDFIQKGLQFLSNKLMIP